MKAKYSVFILVFFICTMSVYSQDMMHSAYHIQGPIPKVNGNVNRIEDNVSAAFLNYIKSDSVNFSLSYFMSYMFPMNTHYGVADYNDSTNEFVLQGFGVMFDTIRDAATNTSYRDSVVGNITVDSLNIIIGQCNKSGTPDTIIIQIDSVNPAGYIVDTVLHRDTIFAGIAGLSPSNNWLNPYNLVVRPNFTVLNNKFAVMVSYFGSKLDTMGFLPGFGYYNCTHGGSGAIPKETHLGRVYGNLTANSLTWGYSYYNGGRSDTIPLNTGLMDGLVVPCTNPPSRFWYFQDNPIAAYTHFDNLTGVNEIKNQAMFDIGQNHPNPFNQATEITYNLSTVANVEFTVSDLTGRNLVDDAYAKVAAGRHSINLSAGQFSPGIYLYTFNVNGSKVTRKMVVTQ
jgi:hypothetical protein